MKIKELFSNSNKWTQNALARDSKGLPITSLDILYSSGGKVTDLGEKAISFSLHGAICYCYDYGQHISVLEKLKSAIKKITGKNTYLAELNDNEYTDFALIRNIVQEAGV